MSFKPFNIGKYYFRELLGKGGMAEVYRVQVHGASGFYKEFAVKRILSAHWTDQDFIKLFEREARLTSMLTHANIVQVYDFFKARGAYLLVMEYIHGRNLQQASEKAARQRVPLPLPMAVYVINEVCKGLEYAFSKTNPETGGALQTIHRDISPHNIMLSYEGAVKILDFGIAKAKDQPNLTELGTVRGKVAYMSPEQALGQAIDQRSDLFSVSLVLLELLTGKKLFSASNDLALLSLVQQCDIPLPSSLNPKIPPALEQVILRALAKRPEDRFATVGEMQVELQTFLHAEYPRFAQKDVAEMMQALFEDEMTGSVAWDGVEDSAPMSPEEQQDLLAELTRFDTIAKEGATREATRGTGSTRASTRVEPAAVSRAARPPAKPKEYFEEFSEPEPEPEAEPEPAPPRSAARPAAARASSGAPLIFIALIVALTGAAVGYKYRRSLFAPPIAAPEPRTASAEAPAETPKRPGTCLVQIDSLPAGAGVSIDGKDLGETPVELPVTCGEPVEVTLSRSQYVTISQRLTFNEQANHLKLSLKKVEGAAPPAEAREPAAVEEPAGEDLTEGEYEKWLSEVSRTNEDKELLAKRYQEKGVDLFNEGRFREAVESFRKSRMLQEDLLPSWFYELQSLGKLGREAEAKRVAERLVARRPALRGVPAVKQYIEAKGRP